MNIIPGEPVPPGFEDEVNRVAEIQQAIDQYKGNALVGLEYTIELHEDDRHEPGYLCVLCDKRGDPRTIMQHWTSFNHRLKYLEKHYPTAVREFQPVKYKPNSHNIMITIVQSLTEAIEDHHGRLTLSVCNADEFRRMKTKIINEVNGKFHYDERNGPNFLNIIDRTLWENQSQPAQKKNGMEQSLQITLKAPKRVVEPSSASQRDNRDDLDEISSDSDGQDSAKKQRRSEQGVAHRVLPRVRRSPPFEEEREKEKKLPTPKELSLQASHIAQERYKWEKYRCMLEIQLTQMEKIQEDYEKSPEKHPLYPEEWKKFWNRRYKELQAEKKVDPNKYDYKPEWIVFWTKRMKELYSVEVEKKKKEIKMKLGLPEDSEEKVDQLKEKYKVQVSRNQAETKNMTQSAVVNKIAGDVIDISDDDSPRRSHRSRSRRSHSRSHTPRNRGRDHKRATRSRSRSLSPFSDDYEHSRHHNHHHYSQRQRSTTSAGTGNSSRGYPPMESSEYYAYSRSRYPPSSGHFGGPTTHYRVFDSHQYPKYEESLSPRLTGGKENKDDTESGEVEGPLTVVAVLRLLTALEEHLGSLGPKVVDLLGKALALEKVKANSADDLLLNEDHCVFFETIKEKLKGLLIADVVDDQQKVRAVKKAIKNIAAVIHQVTTKGEGNENNADDAADSNEGVSEQSKTNSKKGAKGANIKDLPFDRQVVATKLAAALVMQGREDISTDDMDKLIYMFLLMVKLSKPKSEIDGKPMYTKDILPELGILVAKPMALANIPVIVDELLDNEVRALVQEVEEEISNDNSDKESKTDANNTMLESLTDSDLQTLLQNFKHLSTEEQHHLIAHLKKLESADPARVEKLRKFVNLSDIADSSSTSKSNKSNESPATSKQRTKRYDDNSPPSSSKGRGRSEAKDDDIHRRGVTVNNPNKFSLDDEDEDDDYNFEDVFKAASSNVSRVSEEKSHQSTKSVESRSLSKTQNNEPIIPVASSPSALTFNPAGLKISLNDTQNLIANLMGSLQQSNSNPHNSKTSPATKVVANKPQPVPPVSAQQNQLQIGNMPFYQQQHSNQPQQQGYGNASYGQMNDSQASAYYNSMSGYNNGPYGGYPQWGNNAQQIPNMQHFGMQNFMAPQQQHQQHLNYNMYGRSGN